MPSMKSLGMISIVVTLLLVILPVGTLSASNEEFNLTSDVDVLNHPESLNSSTDLNFSGITLFAVVRYGTKYAEQDNQPLLTVSVPPSPGNPWDWQVSGLTGFAPTGNITFTYANDGAGEPNELHTEATMTWSGFQDTEWASGADGSFTLTLTNGVDPDRNYMIDLSLRSLPSISFTVLEDQDQAATDPICAAPAEGPYNWSATGVGGIVPTPTISFNFDGVDTDQRDGRVSVTFAGDWSNQNGTFTLTIADGSRPDSIFDGSRGGISSQSKLSLRKLVGDGYTVIDGQILGGVGVSAAGAEGFSFSASGYSGLSPAPTTLDFNAMGAVTNFACTNWNQDGTFTFTVTDGTRPSSIFNSLALSLRQLIGDGYTVIDGQTSGSDGINAAGALGFTFTASGYAGLSPAPTALDFNAMGAVTNLAATNWNQDGTFTLTVRDGTRPESVITGHALSLRELTGDGYTIIEGQTSGGGGVNTPGVYGFTVVADQFDWDGSPTPTSSSLTFDEDAEVIGYAFADATWTEDGTFRMSLTDGPRPTATLSEVPIRLRHRSAPVDFDRDGISDVVVFRGGAWRFFDYEAAAFDHGVWTGTATGCIPAPMDYDGDGRVEPTQLCGGAWHFYNDDGSYNKGIWTGGVVGDLPVPADYDGDGTDDVVVWRAGAWRFFDFTGGSFDHGVWTGMPAHWLGGTSMPIPMDYDGDGAAEYTVFSGGPWHFYNDDGSYNKGIWTGGVTGDIPVPADYDGDGVEDVVIWRGGAWRFFDFATVAFDHGVWTGSPPHWLGGTPLPSPLDVDGDGDVDFTVFSGGPWHFYDDAGGYTKGIWTGGMAGDLPISRRLLP